MISIEDAMRQRLCEPIDVEGSVADVVRVLLEKNIISPKVGKRKLPFDRFRSEVCIDKNVKFSLKGYRNLFEVVSELCAEHNLRLASEENVILLIT